MTLDDIRKHGALGASQLEVVALREELARAGDYSAAIASFVKAVERDVVLARERDAALARLEAVRALLPIADHGPVCALWHPLPVFGAALECNCTLADIRAALDPTEGDAP